MTDKTTALTGPVAAASKRISESVNKAKREKKVFMVVGGYETIRSSLLFRGWLEKIATDNLHLVSPQKERLAIALMLKSSPFNFIWQPRLRPIKINEEAKPFVNSMVRNGLMNFTTKDGIVHCMNHFHWNYIEGVTDLNIQRTHILNDRPSKGEFFEDFRRTAFTSFILYLNSLHDITQLFYPNGDISAECITYAIQKIELLLKIANHDDIDLTRTFDVCAKFPKDQKKTLKDIQQIISGTKKFRSVNEQAIANYADSIRKCAQKITVQWPHTKYDGFKNIWIFKPVGASSGYGITLTNDESKVNDITVCRSGACVTFVAQKYIERPLLIHNRKFDMRLYLLTMINENHIDVWLYKDCYVKFATNVFNLKYFHKAIHVTNYAVQKYFMNPNDAVPEARENMWTLKQLMEYFEMTGKPQLWQSHIYPTIKKNLLSVIIPSFEITEMTENNFELNGIDVMITFDYEPVLIEINAVPALYFSKTVQEIITRKLLEDVIKVVVDHSKDPSAFTGDFECIHSQEIPWCDTTQNLIITGKSMNKGAFFRRQTAPPIAKKPIDIRRNTETMDRLNSINNRYIYLRSAV